MPFTVGNLSLLKDLRLSHNLLTGEIPPTLGRLELLVSLSIDNNQARRSRPLCTPTLPRPPPPTSLYSRTSAPPARPTRVFSCNI